MIKEKGGILQIEALPFRAMQRREDPLTKEPPGRGLPREETPPRGGTAQITLNEEFQLELLKEGN
jgi:hypothetical protein